MNKNKQSIGMKIDINSVDERQVYEYLEQHPNFFESHPELVDRLYISHDVPGKNAYSLLQWQNKRFREAIDYYKKEKKAYKKAFMGNSYISQQFNLLVKNILKAKKVSQIEYHLKTILNKSFGYTLSRLYLNPIHSDTKSAVKTIKNYLNGNLIYIGLIEENDLKSLNFNQKVYSFVLIQLPYRLGFWLIAHPEYGYNTNKENTALLELIIAVVGYKIKELK